MNREDFERVYLDWVNNFLSIERYAEHYGLYPKEAEALIDLARRVSAIPNPEK